MSALTIQQREYDNWASTGGNDICFVYGMAEKCGPECPDFGLRDGCADMADEYEEDDQEDR